MSRSKNFVEASRNDWTPVGDTTDMQIAVGCLQRIAASFEAIARTQAELLRLEKNRASRLERRVKRLEERAK